MSTKSRDDFRVLRVLTCTVLFKAVIDAVMLVSRLTERHTLLTVSQAVEFINIVACVVCLGGVVALSRKFISVRRIMVVFLLFDCISLLLIMFEMRMIISSYAAAAAVFSSIALFSFTAERLLIGTAFFYLMKGFGGILREEGNSAAAKSSEQLGMIYLCFNSAGAIVVTFAVATGSSLVVAISAALEFVGILLEILMYRRTSETVSLLWKRRTSVTSYKRNRLS